MEFIQFFGTETMFYIYIIATALIAFIFAPNSLVILRDDAQFAKHYFIGLWACSLMIFFAATSILQFYFWERDISLSLVISALITIVIGLLSYLVSNIAGRIYRKRIYKIYSEEIDEVLYNIPECVKDSEDE